jgi:hypothetical protein
LSIILPRLPPHACEPSEALPVGRGRLPDQSGGSVWRNRVQADDSPHALARRMRSCACDPAVAGTTVFVCRFSVHERANRCHHRAGRLRGAIAHRPGVQ